jgi:hypothetical protein
VDLEGIEGLADLPESLIDIKNFPFTPLHLGRKTFRIFR